MHRIWTFLIGLVLERLGRSLALDLEVTALEHDAERQARLRAKAAELHGAGFVQEAEHLLAAARSLAPDEGIQLPVPREDELAPPRGGVASTSADRQARAAALPSQAAPAVRARSPRQSRRNLVAPAKPPTEHLRPTFSP